MQKKMHIKAKRSQEKPYMYQLLIFYWYSLFFMFIISLNDSLAKNVQNLACFFGLSQIKQLTPSTMMQYAGKIFNTFE